MCTLVFTAALFTIAKKWKHPRVFQWIVDLKNVAYTSVEYCAAFKRKEILSHATTWINLEVLY